MTRREDRTERCSGNEDSGEMGIGCGARRLKLNVVGRTCGNGDAKAADVGR